MTSLFTKPIKLLITIITILTLSQIEVGSKTISEHYRDTLQSFYKTMWRQDFKTSWSQLKDKVMTKASALSKKERTQFKKPKDETPSSEKLTTEDEKELLKILEKIER